MALLQTKGMGHNKTEKERHEPLFWGAANGTRTRDLLITNELLYQLS